MNDTLDYISRDPIHRRHHHHQMTFGIHYAFSENFILPISHDEVVHGKGSMITKMPGLEGEKFANLRAYYGFMWGHPGKKLLFMGNEIAQWSEWNNNDQIDWAAAEYHTHAGVQTLVRDLNFLYRETPSLYVKDCEPGGFEWLEANDMDNSIYAWLRRGGPDDPEVVVACNFTPIERMGYRIGLPAAGKWRMALNTDATDIWRRGARRHGRRGRGGDPLARAGSLRARDPAAAFNRHPGARHEELTDGTILGGGPPPCQLTHTRDFLRGRWPSYSPAAEAAGSRS